MRVCWWCSAQGPFTSPYIVCAAELCAAHTYTPDSPWLFCRILALAGMLRSWRNSPVDVLCGAWCVAAAVSWDATTFLLITDKNW